MSFLIRFSPEADEHLRQLSARERVLVVKAIRAQLLHQPTAETRNRKPMRPNSLAPWELRLGALRVYFDVDTEPTATVVTLAIGVKRRSRILIGGEERDL